MTLRDKFIKGIVALGGKEVKRTAKYIVFSTPAMMSTGDYKFLLYVGKSGAVRIGKNLERSRPLTQANKDRLIIAGKGTSS